MKFRVKISLAIQLGALVVSPVFVTELLSANANSVRQISAEAKETLESPRLSLLRQEIQAGKVAALESFWQEIAKHGTPLVEPTTAAHESLVTFVWRSRADTKVVVLTDFGDYVPHMTLRRLTGTDLWYTSLRLRDDARFLYELAVDDPAYPFVDGDSVRYPSAVQPDPLNPKRYEYLKPHIFSLVELQGAPSLQMSIPDATVPHGVVGRFGQLLRSEKLGNERKIFVYKPPSYTDAGEK